MHEACYAQGPGDPLVGAARSGPSSPSSTPPAALAGDEPVLFTGEMIYPWAFELDPALAPAGRVR